MRECTTSWPEKRRSGFFRFAEKGDVTTIMKTDEKHASKNLASECERMLNEVADIASLETGHTRFQLEYLIVNSKPTIWGQYRHACIEMQARVHDVYKLESSVEPQDYHLIAPRVAALYSEIEFLAELARDRRSKLPPGETWEDHQARYFTEQLYIEAWAEYVAMGNISPALLKSMRLLPAPMRDELSGRVGALVRTAHNTDALAHTADSPIPPDGPAELDSHAAKIADGGEGNDDNG